MSFLANPTVLSGLGGIANTAFNMYRENTSYSRAAKDMRRAGLNPLNGLSPLGASGSIDMGFNSALAQMKAQAEIDNLKAQNSSIYAQTRNINADTHTKELQADKMETGIVSNYIGTEKAKQLHSFVDGAIEKGKGFFNSAKDFFTKSKKEKEQ